MKNKQREVGVQLPFIVKDTRTYQELCKDAKEAIQSTAKDWIPRFCMALKRQHPLIASTDIRKKVVNDWSSVWKANTMANHWPDWMKNPDKVAGGKASSESRSKKSSSHKNEQKQQSEQQEEKGESESKTEQSEEQKQKIKDEQKHDTLVDN